ncbi:stage II sporulation protein R [Gracilibacillus thailandensis]|uniref:Stage II sporulation protein R n=1 Tax=Gracilibacillus thailandensis TaxID=563735 RepID=A0A6N7QX26_9BACI|nr:stage II sporulation protein R [Gracilibacillus thailandensis]MRI66094.1 stage II sporulation protein R [Gracilibacillus thailandensis]
MRKLILFSVLMFLIIGFFPQKVTSNEQSYQVIPDEAIRLRILANSDAEKDQELKHAVRDAVNEEVTEWVEEMDDIDEARQLISSRIDDIDQIVKDTVADETYTVEYRKDVKFPTKLYDHYLYPAGEYEAILITLGEAEGSNWWCVIFPPLCFLDFSFGTTVEAAEADQEDQETEEQEEEEKEEEEVEYTFFFLKWFN